MFNKLVKRVALAGALLCGVLTGEAATSQHVTFVNQYSSLAAYTGQDGLFYVREAGQGQNADPTVRSGWACYVWDTRTRRWKIIGKDDIFRLCNVDFSDYLTLESYLVDITPVKNNVKTIDTRSMTNKVDIVNLKVEDLRLEGRINALTNQTGSVSADVAVLKTQMTQQQTTTAQLTADMTSTMERVSTNEIDIAALEGRTTVAEGKIAAIEVYDATNDVNIAALRAKDAAQDTTIANNAATAKSYTDTASNNVVTISKDYTDVQVIALNDRIINAKRDVITNTAIRVHALETRLTNRIDQVDHDVREYAEFKASEQANNAEANAKVYAKTFTTNEVTQAKIAMTEYTDGKVGAAISTAKGYTDTEVYNLKTNLTDKIQTDDATTLASAKSYSDGNLSTAKSYSDGNLTAAKSYTDNATNKVFAAADAAAAWRDAQLNTKLRADMTDRIYEAKTNAIDVAEKYALEQATTKASEAQTAAIAAAATDASTKTNAVLVSANAYADTKKAEAIAYTTDKLDATDKAELEAGTTKFATKKNIADALVGALVFPLQIKKGDVTYTLDVVDDGSGDITLKITK